MAHWEKRTLRLPADHGWSAKDGYNVFVADRGALRLDFPADWITIPQKSSIRFHDRQPPDDRCFFEVSYVQLEPIDWSGLPLAGLLQASCAHEGHPVTDAFWPEDAGWFGPIWDEEETGNGNDDGSAGTEPRRGLRARGAGSPAAGCRTGTLPLGRGGLGRVQGAFQPGRDLLLFGEAFLLGLE